MFMVERLQAASSELSEGLWCTLRLHQIEQSYSASYLVVPTFDILTCDDVLLPKAGSTGAIKF